MVRHASYRSSAVVQLLAELSSTISCFGCLPHSCFISRSVWIRYVSLLHAIALRPLHNARSRPPEAGLRRLPSSFYQSRLPQLWTCGLKNRVHACPLACSTTCGVGLPCGFADIAITLYLRICGKAGNSAFAAFASPPAIKRYDTDVPGTYRHMHLRCRSCRCTANDGWPMPIDSCRHISAQGTIARQWPTSTSCVTRVGQNGPGSIGQGGYRSFRGKSLQVACAQFVSTYSTTQSSVHRSIRRMSQARQQSNRLI